MEIAFPDIVDVATDLTTALTYANGIPIYAATPAEMAAITAVYAAYDALGGLPGPALAAAAIGANFSAAIKDAYDEVQLDRRLAHLRARLLLNVNNCPGCGFGEPTQLDHFLPKSIYENLAIYPRNLIPFCSQCNNVKRTLDPALGPQFVHAYFANIPAVEFLKAEVTINGTALSVKFTIDPAGLTAPLHTALDFQLSRLKLNARYPKQINTFLFAQREGIQDLIPLNRPALIQRYLLRSADRRANDFGLNDWRPVLLRGLADCPEFCDGGAASYFNQPREVGA